MNPARKACKCRASREWRKGVKAIVLLGCLLVAGCVEMTRFNDPAGDLHYVNCEDGFRLESCRSALESACPGGYDLVAVPSRIEGGQQVSTKSGFFRCR